MKKKIIIISNSLGSTFNFRRGLIDRLESTADEVTVFSTKDDSDNVVDINSNVTILTGIWKFIKYSLSKNTDVIHGFTHVGNFLAFCLKLLRPKATLVVNVTGMGRAFSNDNLSNRTKQLAILAFYSISSLLTAAIIVQNKRDLDLLRKVIPNWSKLMITRGSGISRNHFRNIKLNYSFKKTSILVGCFSRALTEKGIHEFYQLADRNRQGPFQFAHTGLHGYQEFSSNRIASYAAENNVSYTAYVPDLRNVLASTDIVCVLGNYREGFPRICIEALCAGRVVIATKLSGIEDVENFFDTLVLAEDSLDVALSRAVTLVRNEDLRRMNAERAIDFFDEEHVVAKYMEAYSN